MRRHAVLIAALIALGVLMGLGAVASLVATEAGARVVFSLLEGSGVVADGVRGRLLGPLEIGKLQVDTPSASLQIEGLRLVWSPGALARGRLHIEALSANSLAVQARPGGGPLQAPQALRLPLPVEVERLQIGVLSVAGAGLPAPQVLTELQAALRSDGLDHRLEGLSLRAQWGEVRGEGRLHGSQPFDLAAELRAGRAGDHVAFTLRAAGTLSNLSLELDARGRAFKGRVHSRLTPFEPLPLEGLDVAVDALDPAALLAGAPHADLSLRAEWRLSRGAQGLQLDGPLTIKNRQPGTVDSGGVPLLEARGEVMLSPQAGRLEALQARFFQGGQARGRAELKKAGLSASLTLSELNLQGLHGRLAPSRLQGEVSVESADGRSWRAQGGLADARLAAQFAARLDPQAVVVERLLLDGGGGRARGVGRLDLSGDRVFEFSGALERFDPSRWASLPRASISAHIEGAGALLPQWSARLSFALEDSTLHTPAGVRPLAGQGRLALSAQRISQADVKLDVAGNRLQATGAFGARGDVLEVLARMPALGLLGPMVSGQIDGSARLTGTLAEPSVALDISARELGLGRFAAKSVSLRGHLQDGSSGTMDLAVRILGVQADGQLLAAFMDASASGTRSRNVVQMAAGLAPRFGGGNLSAQASGGLQPGLTWRGRLETFEHRGAGGALALAAPAPLVAGFQHASVSQVRLQGRRLSVLLDETRWGPGGLHARGSLSGLALSAPGWVEGGVQIGARWAVSTEGVRSARLAVFREAGDIRLGGELPVSLGLADARVELELKGTRLWVSGAASGTRMGQVSGRLDGSLAPDRLALQDTAPIEGALAIKMPSIDWVGPLLDANLKTAGQVRGDIRLGGTAKSPIAHGQLRAEGLLIALVEEGLRLQDGVATADFSQGLARVTADFSVPQRPPPAGAPFQVPPGAGRFGVQGEVDLMKPSALLDFKAERANLLARDGQWLMASGEGRLRANREGAKIEGRTRVDAALINYQKRRMGGLSDDVVVLGRDKPAARRFRLDVDLLAEMGEQCHIRAQGLSARLDGQVRLRAQAGAPLQASGSIRAVDGVFDAYGQTLAIERGVVNFQGPLDNPGINVRAIRRGLAVEAGVEVLGTAQAPRVRLVSEPSVPDAEKLSWIVLGRGLDQAGAGAGSDAALLLSAANAILGGREGRGLPQQLARALGFDEVSVGAAEREGGRSQATVAGSLGTARDQGLPGAVVQVGKRLSTSAYLSYEHSLLGLESAVKLTYALSRRVSLVARAGTDNAVDVFYTFSFD